MITSYQPYRAYRGSGSAVQAILIINCVVFVLISLVRSIDWAWLFGLVPRLVIQEGRIWQLVTYMFLHAGPWHLGINMLMLWFFGPNLESLWGKREFLYYYFFTGIGAGLCSFVTSLNSLIPVVGASGAIFGLLVAYALIFPDTIILMFFFIPMKIRHAVVFLALINLFGALSASQSGVAYIAHLGGGLFGYCYLKFERIRYLWHYLDVRRIQNFLKQKHQQYVSSQSTIFNRRVDEILDKIIKEGIESLTEEERAILDKKSKQ